jgi:hypothetical protein
MSFSRVPSRSREACGLEDSNIIPSMGAPVVLNKNTPYGMFALVPLRGSVPNHLP